LRTAQEVRSKIEEDNTQAMATQHQRIQATLQHEPLSEAPPDFEGEGKDINFPISTVTYYRNYTFLGRDDLLENMYKHLESEEAVRDTNATCPLGLLQDHDPECCILHGLGGVGKTQTALEYTYKNRNNYAAIFWVQSDSDQALSSSFSAIADKLQMVEDLGGHDGQNQGRAIKRVEKWLKMTRKLYSCVFLTTTDLLKLDLGCWFLTIAKTSTI
jgi:hypothetical protein